MLPRRRGGFTLAEVLISIVIIGIIGVAFTKLVMQQSRFFTREYGAQNARQVARNSMNLLMSDLRMVQDSGGIDSASSGGHTIRVIVPYQYGLVCKITASATIASLLPVDSSAVALAKYAGYAWRNSSGRYTIVTPTSPQGSDSVQSYATTSDCTGTGSGQAGISTLTINGRAGRVVSLTPVAASASVRTPLFLYQKITYTFAASSAFPGKYGLYRTPSGGSSEEIMAPFDSSARFKFYVTGQDTSQTTVPSLYNIRGVDIVLNGLAQQANPGQSPTQVKMTTAVFFRNRRSF
jgi:prepilin-type N-terminal cleavage/methylation domain-containing protein